VAIWAGSEHGLTLKDNAVPRAAAARAAATSPSGWTA